MTPYELIVGLYGSGAINVGGGRDVNISDDTMLGLYSGSNGTVSVSGVGSTWANGGDVFVGGAGSGAINITDGGQLTASRVDIATETGGSGDVNVTGPNSTLTTDNFGRIAVGDGGTGSLDVTVGGSVVSGTGFVGYGGSAMFGETSVGTALVDGADSNWTISDPLNVGSYNATGTLTISNGGRVTSDTGLIGVDGGDLVSDRSVGTVNVTGSTSLWDNSDDLYLGWGPLSDGTLNITSGGRVNDVHGYVGDGSGSTGNVTVDGLNSLWNNTGNLQVGVAGSGTLTVTNSGTVQANNITINLLGEVRGNGTLVGNVQNHGLVAPGTSVGTLDITGNYTQSADGELRVELVSVANFDRLEITGVAMLDGELTVSLMDGFMPALGDSFGFLFASGGFGGQFAALGLPSLTPGLKWQFNPGGATLFLNVVAGLLGDYNGNHVVDAADYTVWRNTLGSTTSLVADGDLSGTVDAGDYVIWKAHFGESNGSGSAGASPSQAAVPEPASLHFMLAALFAASLMRAVRRPASRR
jgi:T5SS/PEP-CTERM-associated repeat protein